MGTARRAGEPPASRFNRVLVWSAFAVLIVGTFFLQRAVQQVEPGAQPPAETTTLELRIVARMATGLGELARQLPSEQEQQDALDTARVLIDNAEQVGGDTALGTIRVAIIARELRDTDRALALLDKADEHAAEQLDQLAIGPDLTDTAGDPLTDQARIDARTEQHAAEVEEFEALRRDITEFGAVFAGDEPENAQRLIERHGWWAELAFSRDLAPTDPARTPFGRAGLRTLVGMVVGAALLIVWVLAGVAAVIVGLVLAYKGRIVLRYRTLAPRDQHSTTAYGQTAIVFMLGFMGLSLALGALERATSAGWPMFLLWALALVALWPVVIGRRTVSETRGALGWTTGGRGLGGAPREMAAGLFGYFALMPIFLAGLVGTLIMVVISASLSASGGPGEAPSHPISVDLRLDDPVRAIALATLAVLWAPIVEETIFRGALYHQMRRTLAPIAAGLVTGFVFAIIHPQGWIGAPALTAIGFNLAMIREWRGSILGSVTAHAVHNGAIVLMVGLLLA